MAKSQPRTWIFRSGRPAAKVFRNSPRQLGSLCLGLPLRSSSTWLLISQPMIKTEQRARLNGQLDGPRVARGTGACGVVLARGDEQHGRESQGGRKPRERTIEHDGTQAGVNKKPHFAAYGAMRNRGRRHAVVSSSARARGKPGAPPFREIRWGGVQARPPRYDRPKPSAAALREVTS